MDELARFKTDINLTAFALAHGYVLDRRESSRSSFVLRHANGDKIIVATGTDGHGLYFSVRDPTDHGSILDFVQHRQHVSLGQARQILRAWLALPSLSRPVLPTGGSRTKPRPLSHDRAALLAAWHRMAPYTGDYLASRGLHPTTVAVFASRLRQDARGNVALRHDDRHGLSGWEVKNHGFTGFAVGVNSNFKLTHLGVDQQLRIDPPR